MFQKKDLVRCKEIFLFMKMEKKFGPQTEIKSEESLKGKNITKLFEQNFITIDNKDIIIYNYI